MKRLSLISILCSGFVAVAFLPALNADPVKHRTEITLGGPMEIPGMVLEPGTYVMKVPDPYTHGDMVGFYNPDESHLYKLVRTVPARRTVRTSKTVITFEERAHGAPHAIHTWFEPAAYTGFEFVYPKAETLAVAESTPAAVAPPAPAPAPAPVAKEAPPAPAPVEVAQATPPPARTPAPAAAAAPPAKPAPAELPKTASDFPMLLEAGGFLVLAGLCLRLRA